MFCLKGLSDNGVQANDGGTSSSESNAKTGDLIVILSVDSGNADYVPSRTEWLGDTLKH